ncbi:Ig-like domain-containing protein [Salinimicrobium sp. GXAS 041]|uniref:Ig-like domain-containing protein n=1 Tax=Salinimicrobium sp. GXAS 041 TaxID=3400806 RepID=UPI003C760DE2
MKKNPCLFLAILLIFSGSCSKDDNPEESLILESNEEVLYFGDKHQIQATSETPVTYSSNDEYHAEVSADGLITARFVGQTTIELTNEDETKEIAVTIEPRSTLYPDPNLEFGISQKELIAEWGTPDVEVEEGIAYSNFSTAAPLVMYLFNENNEMESLAVMVETSYSKELGTYLAERYFPADPENLLFINDLEDSKTTMLVGAELYDQNHWMVIYLPFSATKKTPGSSHKTTAAKMDEFYKHIKSQSKH